MFKKIMSLMLAVVMLMSVAVIAASAAQVEIADNSADAIAEVAADGAADTGADAGAETGAGNVFKFDAASAGWNNFKKVFCHIWVYNGDSFYAWQAKKEACTDNGDGTWTYDLDAKGVALADGELYGIIFSNENGMQTYNLLAGTPCIGDTAYCDGTTYENPEDSSKTAQAAFWKGQDPTVYGPEKCVTSIGNIVGTCVPSVTSPQAMFEDFLANKLTNAQTYSGKDDQTLLDDTAKALDLKQENVSEAIKVTGVTVNWSADKSTLEKGKNEEATKTPTGEDKGGDTENKGSDDKGSNENANGGSTTTTGGSGGSTKTGSGSTTKTGQETTVLFIMLGVMIAAAGVIVISRKRDRA